ncbi:hypothetical protein FH972_023197 [Carpinus fangiana]|uniref:PCI domain-containing protein n=1 Tax=Carpinus fangiana TaxID=176857 RepID=A0A5N6KUU5_9ROSI|nr:hypothetical protein FH972_023197 [Carpinus fangiana]
MAGTPTVDQFLTEISAILRTKNASKLREYLIIEPPYNELYHKIIGETRQAYPRGNEDALEAKCSNALPEARDGEDGSSWTMFVRLMVAYFGFLRDVNIDNLLDTYNLLGELVQKCTSALGHPTLGVLVLPTLIGYSQMLSRLAIGLDKQPELIAHVPRKADEAEAGETLPERAANIIRSAFTICMNDRGVGMANGKPEGKKAGIYKLCNVCLKVLFQCRKTRNAEQIFNIIYQHSPPLHVYPASERVTFLYYLGRYLWSNNHFFRAQMALQAAYSQCRKTDLKQRRLIVIYLIASNYVLGRFPSTVLLQKPEARGLADIFLPVCQATAKGDLATFRQLLGSNGPHARWLEHFRMRLQLLNRGEVLVWRSLVRKTFLLNGVQGDVEARKAPTLGLADVLALARYLDRQTHPREGSYADPEFEGIDLRGSAGGEPLLPDMLEVESVMGSLIEQGLLGGFISHRQLRFAIQGAKKSGVMGAGFPNVWKTIGDTHRSDEVPGWKKGAQGLQHA